MKRQKGFTLIELLVVIAILGILVVAGLVSLNSARVKARDSQRKTDLRAVSTAMDLYYTDNGKYPAAVGFAAIITTLKTGGYLTRNIQDPVNTGSYVYKGLSVIPSGTIPSNYCLVATFENSNEHAGDNVNDGGTLTDGAPSPYEVWGGSNASCNTAS